MLKKDAATFPARQDEERRLDRRRFLQTACAAVAVAATGDLLGRRLEAEPQAPPPLTGAAVADLAVGEARAIERPGGETLAVRLPGGELVAFDRRCPHLGCPVVWAATRGRFECPCHHAAFDAQTGDVLFGPPRCGLAPVVVRS